VTWIAPRWVFSAGVWVFVPGHWQGVGGVIVQLPPPAYNDPSQMVSLEPPTMYPQPLVVGQAVQGVLQPGDATTTAGAFADDYALTLAAGQPVTIVTRGGPSATQPGRPLDVLTLVLFNGQELTRDDDSAGYPNSRIVFAAPYSGTFVIRVTSYGAGANQGAYTLQTYHGALPWQN
jgi:hypothetical protein